jgi:hypothetical protein
MPFGSRPFTSTSALVADCDPDPDLSACVDAGRASKKASNVQQLHHTSPINDGKSRA